MLKILWECPGDGKLCIATYPGTAPIYVYTKHHRVGSKINDLATFWQSD